MVTQMPKGINPMPHPTHFISISRPKIQIVVCTEVQNIKISVRCSTTIDDGRWTMVITEKERWQFFFAIER